MSLGSDVRAAFTDPAENLAFDEALLRVAPGSPVLWLWRNPVCVVVGRGQRIAREVRTEECARDGVPVLRRASGGGTVFHDPGNLNVTLVLPGPADRPLEALGKVMSAAVDQLGLVPRIGDRGLFVGTAKLCGFAVFRTKTGLLAHSTPRRCSAPSSRVHRRRSSWNGSGLSCAPATAIPPGTPTVPSAPPNPATRRQVALPDSHPPQLVAELLSLATTTSQLVAKLRWVKLQVPQLVAELG